MSLMHYNIVRIHLKEGIDIGPLCGSIPASGISKVNLRSERMLGSCKLLEHLGSWSQPLASALQKHFLATMLFLSQIRACALAE